MDQPSIVTISSDEDEELVYKANEESSESVKDEIVLDDDMEVYSDSQKRKACDLNDISTATKNKRPEKRIKLSTSIDDINSATDTLKLEVAKDATDTFSLEKLNLLNDDKSINIDSSDIEKKNSSTEKSCNGLVKPQLIIKKRIPLLNVSAVEGDAFAMLVHQCLQNDGSSDMKKIIKSLQKHYDRLDPDYANSEDFITYLTETRNNISKGQKGMFRNLLDVKNTIIDRRRKNTLPNTTNQDSSGTFVNNEPMKINNVTQADKDQEYRNETRLKKIEHKMSICSKRIKALEQAEVDFDDESNSHYIKLERYKERMVELYAKYCSITGDNVDAGRAYLRPKPLSVTNIMSLDQAITSFVNSKISKITKNGKKRTRHTALANALIFPNYKDILQCVEKCNDDKKLGMSKEEQQKTAKKAFTDIGIYLQRVRQNDFWDTFSLHLENEDEDPAVTNEELSKKLQMNQRSGEKKLVEMIDRFAEIQEEADHLRRKEKGLDENAEESEKSEDSNSVDEDNEDDDNEDEENEDDEDEEEDDEKETDKSKNNSDADNDNNADTEAEEDQDDKTDKDNIKTANKVYKTNAIKESDNSVLEEEDRMTAASTPETSESHEKEDNSQREVVEEMNEIKATNIEACMVGDLKESNNLPIPKEEKPLLRVRSFAKPPCSWKDSTQEMPKKLSATTVPLVVITNETPGGSQKLTIDQSVKTSPAIKRTFQVNCNRLNNVMPNDALKSLLNSPKVIRKNVINVKNITNNYVVAVPKVRAPIQPSSSNTLSVSPIKRGTIIRIPNHPTRIIQQIAISKKPSTTRQENDVICLTPTKNSFNKK